MPKELSTTRAADGALTTRTPSMAAAPDQVQQLLQQLVIRRLQGAGAPTAPRSAGARVAPTARQAAAPQPTSGPTLGTGPARGKVKAPVTRMRRVYTPTAIPSMIPGSGYRDQVETQLEDGSWSLDGVHGTLETTGKMAVEQAANMPTMQNPFPNIGKLSPNGGGTWGLNDKPPVNASGWSGEAVVTDNKGRVVGRR